MATNKDFGKGDLFKIYIKEFDKDKQELIKLERYMDELYLNRLIEAESLNDNFKK